MKSMNTINKSNDKIDVPSINSGRLKHLEMIQAIISRMAGNSFLIKGWSLTLLAAILTLALKDRIYSIILIAFIPVCMFWLLDSFFLRQERMYRNLWDVKRKEAQHLETDFSLIGIKASGVATSWFKVIFSETLVLFHGALLFVLILIMALISCSKL
jgi:hypothetical protein